MADAPSDSLQVMDPLLDIPIDPVQELDVPVEMDVSYNALGRKFPNEPEKLALSLSKEGAQYALFVSVGHVCTLPDLEPDLLFQVLSVKPWSAYIELRTIDGAAHQITGESLRLGGVIRVRIGASPLEECAVSVLRLQKSRPKSGLKLGTLIEFIKSDYGFEIELPPDCELPLWLEQSSLLTTTFSELREDWFVKRVLRRTALERTITVLVSPETRVSEPRAQQASIEEVAEKLKEVAHQLAGPPLVEGTMLRHWLEASPYFEVSGDDIMIFELDDGELLEAQSSSPGPGSVGPMVIQDSEAKTTKASTSECAVRTEHIGQEQQTAELRDMGNTRAGNARDRRYGRAMKILDELDRLNGDALKLSRDKRRISEECADGLKNGSVGDSSNTGSLAVQLLEVLRSAPQSVEKLEEEVKLAVRDGAVNTSKARSWQSSITSHVQCLRELALFLEQSDRHADTGFIQRLTHARHRLRDFQQEVLDEVTAALSGSSIDTRPVRQHHASATPRDPHQARDVRDCSDVRDEPHKRPPREFNDMRGPPRKFCGPRDVRDCRDVRDVRDGRINRHCQDNGRLRCDSRSQISSPDGSDLGDIHLNAPDLYEVQSSEGPWYPATIKRLKRNGRYEADLFGAGFVVLYPSVKRREIRLRHHAAPRSGRVCDRACPRDSRSRDERSCDRRSPRDRSRGRPFGRGPRKGRW